MQMPPELGGVATGLEISDRVEVAIGIGWGGAWFGEGGSGLLASAEGGGGIIGVGLASTASVGRWLFGFSARVCKVEDWGNLAWFLLRSGVY
ncbi:hypothetical protein Acr_12g0007980 [Actinidia rufa]|uniref:Uncharacterized protein n=1 Tax=Actinidia rufa TaxID=165716 RepID=A0A7J0FK16_9ERIC|nr:hypothetical protein Acr_12g0007980 [Actinidia rufa]